MSQRQHKQIVRLRWYKGKNGMPQVSYDENGNALNENAVVKLMHGTLEWKNFLKQSKRLGFVKLEVEGVYDHPYSDECKVDTPDSVIKEVKDAFFGGEEVKELTAEQKEIKELREAVKRLSEKKEPVKTISDDLKSAREDYMRLAGKKGHHSWDVNKIRMEISKIEKDKN